MFHNDRLRLLGVIGVCWWLSVTALALSPGLLHLETSKQCEANCPCDASPEKTSVKAVDTCTQPCEASEQDHDDRSEASHEESDTPCSSDCPDCFCNPGQAAADLSSVTRPVLTESRKPPLPEWRPSVSRKALFNIFHPPRTTIS